MYRLIFFLRKIPQTGDKAPTLHSHSFLPHSIPQPPAWAAGKSILTRDAPMSSLKGKAPLGFFSSNHNTKKVRLGRKIRVGKKKKKLLFICHLGAYSQAIFSLFKILLGIQFIITSKFINPLHTTSQSQGFPTEARNEEKWKEWEDVLGNLSLATISQGTCTSESLFLILLLLVQYPPSSFYQQVPNLQHHSEFLKD